MGRRHDSQTDALVTALACLASGGHTIRSMGRVLGVSSNTTSRWVRDQLRHGPYPPYRPPVEPPAPRAQAPDFRGQWTESRLTEPWAEYRARRQAERASHRGLQ